MTPQLTAALQVMEQTQAELEADATMLQECDFTPLTTQAIRNGLKIRIWLQYRNLKALEELIIAELDKEAFNPELLQQ